MDKKAEKDGKLRIRASVREVVEFLFRGGSIDFAYRAEFYAQNRAQEGIRVHAAIQKAREADAKEKGYRYEKEVALRETFALDEGSELVLEGRADGVIESGGRFCVEEIKSTSRDTEALRADEAHWHVAQAKCYAYMFIASHDEEIGEIGVILTYCNIATRESVSFQFDYSAWEIAEFMERLVGEYSKWALWEANRVSARDRGLARAEFPYASYRGGQREFAVAVYRAIREQKKLFAEAPTGVGKTISALFPAVKALGEGLADKIFYITAKTVTRAVAEDAASGLNERGAGLLSLTLTAKERACLADFADGEEISCSPAFCEYADGHFDRVNAALWELLQNERQLTREVIKAYAARFRVCPFELGGDLSRFADIIICDYNYVFDPAATLRRFFGQSSKGSYILLCDEAHNLVERSRGMYSASLSQGVFRALSREFRKRGLRSSKVRAAFASNKIIAAMDGMRTEDMPEALRFPDPLGENDALKDFLALLGDFAAFAGELATAASEDNDYIRAAYFAALDFLACFELALNGLNDNFAVVLRREGKDVRLDCVCLDASRFLQVTCERFRASVFFSATLTPMSYFVRVLGGKPDDYGILLPSPFPRENLSLIIDERISTRYKHRTAAYPRVASAIRDFILQKAGNYLIFFSSYDFLENTLAVFRELAAESETEADIIVQTRSMSEDGRADFLGSFTRGRERTLVGFAVLGGVFSEGIDLAGDKLIGVCVVGVGLPQISLERDIIKEYYDKTENGMGFEFAYVYPGFNKVMQAAGRLIRGPMDKGAVLLIDERFGTRRYLEMFPEHWRS